MGLYIIV